VSAGNQQQGVDVNQVASLLNLTPRRIQQLSKDGVIPKPERGRYHLAGCIRGYIAFLQKSVDAAKAKAAQPVIVDLQRERARKTAAEAELAEMELAVRRGDFVAVSDYEAALARVLDRLMARLRAMPVRLSHLGDECEAAVESEVEAVVVELSQMDEDVIEEPQPTQQVAA
jgi:phage terminase Nu1 subunit (DNA packaging protein)